MDVHRAVHRTSTTIGIFLTHGAPMRSRTRSVSRGAHSMSALERPVADPAAQPGGRARRARRRSSSRRETLPRVIELLKPSDFYKEGHRKIFDAMLALFERNEPVDLLTLSEELRAHATSSRRSAAPPRWRLLVEEAVDRRPPHLLRGASSARRRSCASSSALHRDHRADLRGQGRRPDAARRRRAADLPASPSAGCEGSALPGRAILKDTFEHIERLYERKEHVTGARHRLRQARPR